MDRAAGTHIDVKLVHERRQNLIAVITVDADIPKQRSLRHYAISGIAREIRDKRHDFFFE